MSMTKAQRTRKVAAATKKLNEARELLREVCDDFSDYMLKESEWAEWRKAADLCAPLDRMNLGGE